MLQLSATMQWRETTDLLVIMHKAKLMRCGLILRIHCGHKQIFQPFDVGIEVCGKEGLLVTTAPEPQQHDATKNESHHDAEPTSCTTQAYTGDATCIAVCPLSAFKHCLRTMHSATKYTLVGRHDHIYCPLQCSFITVFAARIRTC